MKDPGDMKIIPLIYYCVVIPAIALVIAIANRFWPRKTKRPFAIIRVDEFMLPIARIEESVTVKKIVWSEEEADNEVNRLNDLNRPGARYFWQCTRE